MLNGAAVARASWRGAYVVADMRPSRGIGKRIALRTSYGYFAWEPHSIDRAAADWLVMPREQLYDS